MTSTTDSVSFFFEGDDYFESLKQAVIAAESAVDIEIYHIADDAVGVSFSRLLKLKAHEGVGIRMIYDAVGCLRTSDDFFVEMDHAGIQLKVYHPISGFLGLKGSLVRRNHRKCVVVDGKRAFLGGFNLASEYSKEACGEKAWRDTGVMIDDLDLVSQLKDVFRRSWKGRADRALDYFQGRSWRSLFNAEPASEARILSNDGWRRRNLIRRAYLWAIRRAEKKIWITNSYFVPDRGIRRALRRAALRGVDVRLLTAGVSDVPIVRWAGQATYSRLLRAGARIFEFQGRTLHAKSAVIDWDWYTVGTSNLDHLSFFKNLEVNLFARSASAAKILSDQFERDLGHSHEIRLEEWGKRSWLARLRERFFFFFRRWL